MRTATLPPEPTVAEPGLVADRARPPASRPATSLDVDPFTPPARRVPSILVRPRQFVAVEGLVMHVTATEWVGGPVMEAVLNDGTGALALAFLGRRGVGGVEVGRRLVAAGTVVRHSGHLLVMKPLFWLVSDRPLGDAFAS